MYIFNAFVSIPELANNSAGKVAKFGELSSKSLTFSKDIRNYANNNAYPNIELVSFSALDDSSTPLDTVSETIVNTALSLSNFLYTQYNNNAIPINTSKKSLITGVNKEFPLLRNLVIGEIIESGLPGKRLIDYIRYDQFGDGFEYRITLWFSDAKFRTQYPFYEIEVIPPLGDIARLIDTPANVIEALNSIRPSYVVNRLAAISDQYPITTNFVYTVNWHDPAGSKTVVPTDWTAAIYGLAGKDLDVIKDAIRNYLAENSTYQQWPKIFPDLYSQNEFLIIPFWDVLATPTDGYDDGLYGSITQISKYNEEFIRLVPSSYGTAATLSNLRNNQTSIIGTVYRGINAMVVGNPNNKDSMDTFTKMFPDYMAVGTDRSDFSRMSKRTQNFILLMLECFETARNYTLNTILPDGFTKAVKAKREYIGFEYEGFRFFMISRFGYLKEL